MKKYFFLFCSLLVLMLLSSCASIATTKTARLYWSQPYEVLSKTYENIEESWTDNIMPVYKDFDKLFGNMNIVSIGKKLPSKERMTALKTAGYNFDVVYYFSIHYQGPEWKFIKNLDLKTDNKIFKLEDTHPERNTVRLSTVFCAEEANFYFYSEDEIQSLLNTKALSLQYTGSPIIKLSDEAIQKIKEFIKSDVITIPSKNW